MIYDAINNTIDWKELQSIEEINRLKDIPQNEIWHKEGNVYIHTCLVTQAMLDYINDNEDLRFTDSDYRQILVYSALLHDVGKYVTSILGEDGLYHNPNHANEGVKIVEQVLDTLGVNKLLHKSIISLVKYHMQPLYISTSKNPEKALFKLINKLDSISFEELVILKRCDCKGAYTDEPNTNDEDLNKVLDLYHELCYPAGTYVSIKKIESLNYKDGHPNNINEGYTNDGKLLAPVTVGWRTSIRHFSTSPVKKIIDKFHFETENSIYEIYEII